ncbi:hypothetical protein OHA70_29175 [Kribbella sp. NBC_00382]|uniref:hypothetical protein n=1 Tax=Kribbella sp. NBC_00382 TaxID=2975967 RepID=UPI002E21798B
MRIALLGLATLCLGGLIALSAARSRRSSPRERITASPSLPTAAMIAVARTHFVDGGGYIEIGGVLAWASADPVLRILPGQVLDHEPAGDGHTFTVSIADSVREEQHP